MRSPPRAGLPGLLLVALVPSSPAAEPESAVLARKARAVLETHCYRCHGKEGAVEGGFNFVLQREALIARRKVRPGEPARSRLFKRVSAGEMPPEDEKVRPSEAEVETLKHWIAAGAPDFDPPAKKRTVISPADVLASIRADLRSLRERDRRFTRYLTLTHLHNAGLSEDELLSYRHAVSKLINSLSWGTQVVVPKPIDAEKTVLRIDLRDYKWSEKNWNALLIVYPYGVRYDTADEQECANETATPLPYIRGDWFVAQAARPPLYHDLLQLPQTDRELERELRIDVSDNLRGERAARAGFNGSGVSRNNRLIERHETPHGAYWKSYDFASNTGRQNLFALPLGPGTSGFRHDGGEIIFNLPNGLQAYLLVDARGKRIDKGPTKIVSDPKRPDRAVLNGISCMSCHARGMIEKADQVRGHVEKNSNAFSAQERETILALYLPREKFTALLRDDAERFRKAVEKTGAHLGTTEPIVSLAQRFEAEVDLALASAEAGLAPEKFKRELQETPLLARVLGPLAADGTVQRDVFVGAFAGMVRELRLGRPMIIRATTPTPVVRPGREPWKPKPPVVPPAVVVRPQPLRFVPRAVPATLGRVPRSILAHANGVEKVVFSPDAKRALSCSQDQQVRLWDLDSGKELRRLSGHTQSAACVAYSRDGKWGVSGGFDKTVRVWNLDTGAEEHCLTAPNWVTGVGLSPDRKLVAFSTIDGTARLWEVATGKEVHRFVGHTALVDCLTFAADGSVLLTGGADKTARLWDARTGKELRCLKGHTNRVTSVALSPDGKRAATTSLDRTVRLWDTATGKEVRQFERHTNGVHAVAFSPDGKRLLTGGGEVVVRDRKGIPLDCGVRVWEVDTGKEVMAILGHRGRVTSVAFAPDGRWVLSSSGDCTIRLLDLNNPKDVPDALDAPGALPD
jgi:mono/diheme cytochrome c family protein/sugar lactone lactonase YvrE